MPTLSGWVVAGFVVAGLGLGLAIIVMKLLMGGRILRVPDGQPADEYYRQWEKQKLSKRIPKAAYFLVALAIAMLMGGCGAIVAGLMAGVPR